MMNNNDKGMSFSDKLRFIRERRYLTKSELCKRTGFDRKTIYNWENGKCIPKNYRTIEILSDALDVDPKVFLENYIFSQIKQKIQVFNDLRKDIYATHKKIE